MLMQCWAVLARLHRAASNKNFIGQLLQNAGAPFTLLGKDYGDGVDWRSIKKGLDEQAKNAGASITWPNVFERMGAAEEESDLAKLIMSYAVSMTASKLAIRDILTSEILKAAFPTESGGFSVKAWDTWAKENQYTVKVKDSKGGVVAEFVPSGKLLASLITACDELNKLANYHSHDSVSDREAGGFDIAEFKL